MRRWMDGWMDGGVEGCKEFDLVEVSSILLVPN